MYAQYFPDVVPARVEDKLHSTRTYTDVHVTRTIIDRNRPVGVTQGTRHENYLRARTVQLRKGLKLSLQDMERFAV